MTETEFKRLAAEGFNRVPLVLETFADLDTPLSIYLKLAAKPYSYLLESVQGGERFGRYSFIGLPAHGAHRRARARRCSVHRTARASPRRPTSPTRSSSCGAYLARYRAAPLAGLPRFAGGLVGCFGYETVRYIEPKLDRRPEKPDPIGTPDIVLLQSGGDRDRRQPRRQALPRRVRRSAQSARLRARPGAAARSCSRRCASRSRSRRTGRCVAARAAVGLRRGELPRGGGESEALHLRRRRHAGADLAAALAPVRRARRSRSTARCATLNPSPYMFFFDFRDFHVVGASPEILVRLEGDKVTLRPIAGTRRARRDAGGGPRARRGAARRSEGARRARDADRPRPQRRRPHRARPARCG